MHWNLGKGGNWCGEDKGWCCLLLLSPEESWREEAGKVVWWQCRDFCLEGPVPCEVGGKEVATVRARVLCLETHCHSIVPVLFCQGVSYTCLDPILCGHFLSVSITLQTERSSPQSFKTASLRRVECPFCLPYDPELHYTGLPSYTLQSPSLHATVSWLNAAFPVLRTAVNWL